MALDDQDRAEIADLIAAAQKPASEPARRRVLPAPEPGAGRAPGGDWDMLSPRDQQSYVRQIVEDRLAELDAEAERADLIRERDELKAALKKWEDGGKQGRRPTRESVRDGDKRGEETPRVVNRLYKFLFGDVQAGR